MINKKLLDDITSYCKLNNIEIKEFINQLLKKAFMVEKYGDRPMSKEKGIFDSTIKEEPQESEVKPKRKYTRKKVVKNIVVDEQGETLEEEKQEVKEVKKTKRKLK